MNAMENITAPESSNLEADEGQSDRFQFPEWATSYMDADVEFKELCLNIQRTARMEARTAEVGEELAQPEAQRIINLIEEVTGLPLRRELGSAMDKLHAAKRRHGLAARMMSDFFGLGFAPLTDTRVPSQKTRGASTSTMPVSLPATGTAESESVPIEHSAVGPTTTSTSTGVATDPPAPRASESQVEAVRACADSMAAATTPMLITTPKLTKRRRNITRVKATMGKSSRKQTLKVGKPRGEKSTAKSPSGQSFVPPTRQSNLEDSGKDFQAPFGHQNDNEPAASGECIQGIYQKFGHIPGATRGTSCPLA